MNFNQATCCTSMIDVSNFVSEQIIKLFILNLRNEEEVGSALKKCGIPREEIYVITKVHV